MTRLRALRVWTRHWTETEKVEGRGFPVWGFATAKVRTSFFDTVQPSAGKKVNGLRSATGERVTLLRFSVSCGRFASSHTLVSVQFATYTWQSGLLAVSQRYGSGDGQVFPAAQSWILRSCELAGLMSALAGPT
jgi:hypothetical protein